ncbi:MULTISPECIES: hypothetical protein [Sporomusaceae]|uniref:hypothetical protein n=1 Tax=Sporomusaceae TaxID=1843490 RepID=UPI000379AEFB|nr:MULTISPECIES: hypothetical protein [Sporomusaceae]
MKKAQEKIAMIDNLIGCYQQFQFPKGINKDTVVVILRTLAQYPENESGSAKDISDALGISQSTLRKYFSFLVYEKFLDYELHYVKVGPPIKKYSLNLTCNLFLERQSKTVDRAYY